MTALPSVRFFSFSWPRRAAKPVEPIASDPDEDMRREYITRLISSESCGEYGAQALMGMFPKDF